MVLNRDKWQHCPLLIISLLVQLLLLLLLITCLVLMESCQISYRDLLESADHWSLGADGQKETDGGNPEKIEV